MPLTPKPWLALISVSILSVSSQIALAQEAPVDKEWEQLNEDIHQIEIQEKEFKESLKVTDTVFDIPVLGNEKSDPETISLTKEMLDKVLDQDMDGKADKPELTEFMAKNDYKVIVAGSSEDLDKIDDDDFPFETTAQITGQGIKVDSYFLENVRLVAEAQVALLKKKAAEQDPGAVAELKALDEAITQLQDNGLVIVDDDDDDDDQFEKKESDDDQRPEYILMSELSLSGQLATLLERLNYAAMESLKKTSALTGKDYLKEAGDSIIPESYKNWGKVTPDAFHEKGSLMNEWLTRNKLSAPAVALSKRTPAAELISVEDISDSELSEAPQVTNEQTL